MKFINKRRFNAVQRDFFVFSVMMGLFVHDNLINPLLLLSSRLQIINQRQVIHLKFQLHRLIPFLIIFIFIFFPSLRQSTHNPIRPQTSRQGTSNPICNYFLNIIEISGLAIIFLHVMVFLFLVE